MTVATGLGLGPRRALAATASFSWFAALGYGSRLLAPVFARPAAWRVLDALVGLTMLALAASLLVRVES